MRKLLVTLMCCATFTQASSHQRSTLNSLIPSKENLLRQNLCVDQMNLTRIKDEAQLAEFVAAGKLTALPYGLPLQVSPSLPAARRYALPRTNRFLVALSEDFYATFHAHLTVDSAVRPKDVQEKLLRSNHSAAPVDISTHYHGGRS